MKDFGDWLLEQGKKKPEPYELPEGVWLGPRGQYRTTCCACERDVDMLCDLADYEPNAYYCGGGPLCCP